LVGFVAGCRRRDLLRSMTGVGEFSNQYGPRRSVYLGVKKEF
jgi:hypothetical protein